jgi:hypothetical protein
MDFQVAEGAAQRDMLFAGQVLIAEEQNLMAVQKGAKRIAQFIGERFAEIDALDLRTDRRLQRADGDVGVFVFDLAELNGHGLVPIVSAILSVSASTFFGIRAVRMAPLHRVPAGRAPVSSLSTRMVSTENKGINGNPVADGGNSIAISVIG